MNTQYHILNGDALSERFPKSIGGQTIIARECLVDGDVLASSLEELYSVRAQFLSKAYELVPKETYYQESVAEFEKIQAIPPNSEIHLWFEDDLFCQVNFWFCANLIHHSLTGCKVYLIRPKTLTPFGFSGLNEIELIASFNQRVRITQMETIAELWPAYQHENHSTLRQLALDVAPLFPFISDAVEAHIERIPDKDTPGRPMRTLQKIMEELGTQSFGPVFKEFCRREPIYGFGDLQVKRLFDSLINHT